MRAFLIVVLLVLVVVLGHRGYLAWELHQQTQRKIDVAVRVLSIPIDASGKQHALYAAALPFRRMLFERRFAELEATEIDLRQSAALIGDGQPRLAAFYRGISMCRDSRCPDYAAAQTEWARVDTLLSDWAAEGSALAKLARVNYTMSAAWTARGQGMASSVSADQWKQFKALMTEAAERFEALPEHAQASPLYAELALGLAKTGHFQRARAIQAYERLRAEYPWYLPMYFQRAALAASKWGAPEGAHGDFVEAEIARAYSADFAAVLYARLHWSNQRWEMFSSGDVDWQRFAKAFERLVELYPDQWNVNSFAFFACSASDAERLQAQINRLEQVIVPAWHSVELYAQCRDYLLRFKLGDGAFEQARQRVFTGDR